MSPSVNEKFGFKVGEVVRMLEETMGDHEGEEFTFPVGTYGIIHSIEHYGDKQGWSFTVDIGGKITNVFDEGDGMPEQKYFESTGLTVDRLKNYDLYSNAAYEIGERVGKDGEIDALLDLIASAMSLMTDEQKIDLFFDGDVQDILDQSGIWGEESSEEDDEDESRQER